MSSVAAEVMVSGVVQGVGFRYYCYRQANSLNLYGWVKNLPDGSVLTYIEGDKSAVEAYIKQLKIGFSSATVTDVKITREKFTGTHQKFEILMD